MIGPMSAVAVERSAAQSRLRWELLVNLVRKDLKVKYQSSALGFAWSLATPLLLLSVYYVVFGFILRNGVPSFAVYLMAGLLPWNAFATSVTYGCGSVVANANLVGRCATSSHRGRAGQTVGLSATTARASRRCSSASAASCSRRGRHPHRRAAGVAARARRRLPPRPHRPRERLPQRVDPRHRSKRDIDAPLRRDRRFAELERFIDSR
jgi:hypothetical protein